MSYDISPPEAPVNNSTDYKAAATDDNPLASLHTQSFTEVLVKAGVSVAISTYQAGKVILARADGGITNTHFRNFRKPMGMASAADRLTIGAGFSIHDLRNAPSAARGLTPPGKHNALYLPRSVHHTGDIDIHEMAWQGEDLYFVNTKFSCLCRFDPKVSFEPVWRPPFISAYDMRDRCHLNGLGTRDGKVRYVSALAQTDTPAGWRQHKTDGGFVMDLETEEIVASGLAMPHSPRWHEGALWYLESGNGTLCRTQPGSGKKDVICKLPGFTRGLDFVQNLAFIGISQVRETAVFSGLEITQSQAVRDCGVWVVDIRSGEICAFLKFTQGVQEIFSVCVLPHTFPDIITDDDALLSSTYVLRDELIANVVQPDPNWESADKLFEQGNRAYNDGHAADAIALYKRALTLDAGYLPARFNLGIALSDQQQWGEARQELELVLKQEAGHVEALNSLGFIATRQGDIATARSCFERALAIRPNFKQAQQNLRALTPSDGALNSDYSG
ncbi:MAG: TIGR03032 family protein [Haliea sp.]|nr:TIGR03032 family protein [Haliea sp.]